MTRTVDHNPNPAFVKLMQIEVTFHDVRKYLTPMNYRGSKILAHVGSCKQSKCNWGSSFANREGLTLGIWKHRQQHILERRRELLWQSHRTQPARLRTALVDRDMSRAADRLTHTESDWKDEVKRGLITRGVEGFDLEEFDGKLLTFYAIGMMAAQVAQIIWENNFAPLIKIPHQVG